MPLLLDTRPLRVSRDYRQLWSGQAVSFLGSMMTAGALPYQVFHETRSSLDVGLLGLAQLVPLLAFSVVGGAFADGIDKRRMLLGLTSLSLLCSAGLTANALVGHPLVWLLYLLGPLSSAVLAATAPVVRSLLPLLLERELRPAGFALQSSYGSFGMMVGPAVGGLVIGSVGLPGAYGVDVATFLVAVGFFFRLSPAPPVQGAQAASRQSLLEGLRFLRGSLVMSVFGIDLLAMVFGMPRALFPALAVRLGGGPALYGLLLAAIAAGAFVASVTSAWTGRVRRQGRAVLLCVALWGAAITGVGLTRQTTLVLSLLALGGAADMVSGVFRSTIAADVTPDSLRGRVSGAEFAVYAGGPVLGDVEAGVVGGVVSTPFAIVSGGIACVVGAAAFAVLAPRLFRYVAGSAPEPALAVAS